MATQNKRLRVAHIINPIARAGAQMMLLKLVQYLSDKAAENIIVTFDVENDEFASLYEASGVTVF